jgi:hypothetical protein
VHKQCAEAFGPDTSNNTTLGSLGLNQLVEVPTGRYSDALLTRDTTSLEPAVVEYKL